MTTSASSTGADSGIEQFLSFSVTSDVRAILPTRQLTEVLSIAINQIVPIPDVPPQVMGVCNWRGEVLWLIDLGYLLGADPLLAQGYRQSNYSAIVAHHQGCTIGLVVDQVSQMLWCNPAQIQPIPTTQLTLEPSPYLQGYWLAQQGETLLVLSAQALVNRFHR